MSTIPLGEDILLARHGSNIVKLRQDRKNRQTVAYLRDGATDTAANVLGVPALTPAATFGQSVQTYLNDEAAVSRKEVRSLAKLSLGFSAFTGAVFGGLLLLAYKVGGSELLDNLSAAYSYYPM
ncbi:hypothetical protein ACF046_06415 [Glutamicibacter creatinolyticus]|uniref:FAD-dependent oxidoreductase n=1 Tax=Glutamicibacter creatinolyticus TaxID=162496 RepID=A0A5B7WVG5_9MICC|nr:MULTISPECIES: hypothetical protein [Micrococcaceae]QCY48116.1 FAD-dependent oxidoreductase [Glutamicibacter creatinolyticus]TLK52816.1 hypothetical protein FDN03_08260 [Glutamicibacter sp. V16R2B1]